MHRNLGVHVSFVRSTVLDSWTYDQLRIMKVGGNQSATEYFSKHMGASLLAKQDAVSKYTSRAALTYKDELKRRAERDAKLHPDLLTDTSTAGDSGSAESSVADDSDDFFSSWDKPVVKRPTPPPSRISTPPIVGRTPSPLVAANARSTMKPTSTLRTATSARKSVLAGTSGAKRSDAHKRAEKAGAVDFEAAERSAREEAERIKQLGYNEELEKQQQKRAAATAASSSGYGIKLAGSAVSVDSKPASSAPSSTKSTAPAIAKLGFGQIANKQPVAAKTAPTPAASTSDDYTSARDRFSGQKSISSDQYFNRGAYDPAASAEAKSRLSEFSGATAISSNAYFGRPEPEDDENRGESGASLLQGRDLGELETVARDYLQKLSLTAGEDIDNLRDALTTGGRKLQGFLENLSERYNF